MSVIASASCSAASLRSEKRDDLCPRAVLRAKSPGPMAQCCLLVDHIRSERCAPCRRYYAVPWLKVHNATPGLSGHTTYRLMLDLVEKRAANVYTVYGDKLAPLILPGEHIFNEPSPAGVNLGGVWPALR